MERSGAGQSFSVAGNELTLLTDGPERLAALLDLIANAKQTLRVLYYIFDDDRSGHQVRDALLAAQARGVAVSLLIDGFGTASVPEQFWEPLRRQCTFCQYSPKLSRRYLLRNHQKLALADDEKVIIGGFNVADSYFGTVAEGAWRDLGLIVEGPIVAELATYFDELLAWTQQPKSKMRDLRRLLTRTSAHRGPVRWLLGGPARKLSPWAIIARADMRSARQTDIIAAYFAPGVGTLRRFGRRAQTGGKARLLTAAKSDNATTIAAARSLYFWLLKRNVRVFEYQATRLHTKLLIADNVVQIGSANFDVRSMFLNLELMLRVENQAFADAARAYFEGELRQSREFTPQVLREERTFFRQIVWSFAYFVVSVLDYNISRRLNFGADGE